MDNSSDTTVSHGHTSLDKSVSASVGTHTVHVKAWGSKGAVCVSEVSIDVVHASDDASSDSSTIPSSAVSVSGIQAQGNWKASHDTGASGSASGKTSMVGSPSHSGPSRRFVSTFKNNGAERYSVAFGDNRTSTHFFYDAWIYLTSSASKIANIEMDINQTMSNGQTVIFGFQCAGGTGKWEYTRNLGSAKHPKGHWQATKLACNPRNWSKDKWHHVQVEYSRTSGGTVTYQYVWLDGKRSTINAKTFAARSLGWGSTLTSNFQIDGHGSSGSSTVYLGALRIYRW